MQTREDSSRLFGEHFLHEFSEDEQAVLAKTRRLARELIGPQAAQVGREDVFAWETFRLLADEGIVATAFPREYGGSDARQVLRIRIIEELGRVCSAAASLITGTDLSSRAIVAGASDAFKGRLLPGLCTGEIQSAFALTEPGAGTDVRGLATTIDRDGECYRINGEKKFITRASTADWFVVVGRGSDAAAGFIAVLVPRASPGLTVGPDEGKLGWYGVPIASLRFDDLQVPVDHRLGAEGDGFALAQDALLRARIGHAAMALGRAMGAVEIAAAYATERDSFGKPLGAHQGVQWMLAEMFTRIEATRALLTVAAAKYDRGDADVAAYASMAKLQATDLGMQVITDALQLTGGRGYLKAFPLERFFRDAKLNQIGEGASEIHKTVIGRDLVRRVRDMERHPCLRDGPLEAY
ncbi:MAG: acyl-CoA dehydrogenase family protein [Burkholderiaceae bacterium]